MWLVEVLLVWLSLSVSACTDDSSRASRLLVFRRTKPTMVIDWKEILYGVLILQMFVLEILDIQNVDKKKKKNNWMIKKVPKTLTG